MPEQIKDRLARVQELISRAAHRAGRPASEITLLAVSKTFAAPAIQEAIDAGVRDLGENRVQEALDKVPHFAGQGVRWHLIGHLQSNKARPAVLTFNVIHSVDSQRLAERLDRIASEEHKPVDVLVQVDLGGEPTKSGATEDELPEIIETLDQARSLRLRGLMLMPPFFDDPERTRPYFRRLRRILEGLNQTRPVGRKLTELSMGMSHDFEVAIEEGATMVRVGTAIFGARANHG
jgi:hypothetical protein